MLNGIARLAQFAVSCDHVGLVDHDTRLAATPHSTRHHRGSARADR
jgi:hypothetical protein